MVAAVEGPTPRLVVSTTRDGPDLDLVAVRLRWPGTARPVTATLTPWPGTTWTLGLDGRLPVPVRLGPRRVQALELAGGPVPPDLSQLTLLLTVQGAGVPGYRRTVSVPVAPDGDR